MPAALVRPRWTAHAATDLGFVVFTLAAAFALFHDAWASPATRLIGVSEDPVQNVWLLGLTQHALAHGMAPWTTTLIDAPSGVNLMWSPLMPLASLLLWPVTATAGPVVAYNVLATLTPVLSAAAAYFALRYFVRDRVASWIGALLYGFSPYAIAQLLGHPHAALGITPPLLLVVLNEVLVRHHGSARRNGLLLAALVSVQFFLSVEVLASELVMTVLGVAILAVRYPQRVRDTLPSLGRVVAWAAPPVLLLCAWPLAVQVFGPGHVSGHIWPPSEFSADALNLVVPSALLQVAPASLQQIPFQIDTTSQVWSSYIGIPVLALAAVTLVRLRRRFDVVLFAALLAIAAVLSLGPSLLVGGHDTGVPLPMKLLMSLPLLGNLDADRFTLYASLFAAVLAALLVADVRARHARTWIAPVLVVVACVSVMPAVHFPYESATVPSFFSDGATAIPSGSTALVLPLADSTHPAPMLWQATAAYRFAMTGGYAIRGLPGGGATTSPPDGVVASLAQQAESASHIPVVSATTRARALAELRADGVTSIVVGPDSAQRRLVELVTRLIGAAPEWRGGVAFWPVV
jgi:hypothetical protein